MPACMTVRLLIDMLQSRIIFTFLKSVSDVSSFDGVPTSLPGFAEGCRGCIFGILKDFDEVSGVTETALFGYGIDGFRGKTEHRFCFRNTDVI